MKKLLAFLAVVAVAAMPLAASAATIRSGHDYTLPQKDMVSGDLYVASGTISFDGNVNGDIVATGGRITLNGSVAQDAILAGGMLTLKGTVQDDLRVAGGQIDLLGRVGDDVFVTGGKVHALPGSTVGGDLYVAGGSVVIDGNVNGDIYGTAGSIEINGTVRGHVKLVSKDVVIGRSAVLDQGLWYRSGHEAQVQAGAQIIGPVEFVNSKVQLPNHKEAGMAFFAILQILTVLKFLMLVVLVLAVVLLLRKIPTTIIVDTLGNFWHTTLIGFVVAVTIPVSIVLLAITIIGLPIALMLGLAYAFSMILAKALGAIMVGALIHQLITKVPTPMVNWKTALVGAVAYCVLGAIPFFGWIVVAIFSLAGFGGVALYWHRTTWKNR